MTGDVSEDVVNSTTADPDRHDNLDRPDANGSPRRRVWVERSTADRVVDLLVAYRWPVVLGLVGVSGLVGALALSGNLPDVSVPPEVWGFVFFFTFGTLIAAAPAWWVVRRISDPKGVEVLDLDPVGDDHRHLRVGSEAWSDLTVLTPWGEETTTADLRRCTINGRTGVEVMDLRADPDDGLVCVTTHLGEVSSAELRTYEESLEYARTRLSRRANRATALRANLSPLVREAAEKVVYRMIRTSERSGVPGGEEIERAVDDVVGGMDVEDRDPGDDDPVERERDRREPSNGHDPEASVSINGGGGR